MSLDARRDFLLPNPVLAALLLALGAVIAPHMLRLPVWLSLVIVGCGLWRMRLGLRGDPLPPVWLRVAVTAAVTLGVFFSYGTIAGRDAGTALLSAMAALKLLEMRRPRDVQVVLYLAYFLVITQFLYSQSLWLGIYMLVLVWATTTVLISTSRPTPTAQLRQQARTAGSMLLQALPIMAVLFVLFPRISGPLWGLPEDAYRGTTGLSDHMSMGSISELSQSGAVAFRVQFAGTPPPRDQRYWRGPVFSAYDGRTWSPGTDGGRIPALVPLGEAVNYRVTLQPHDQHWLFALDLPGEPPANSRFTREYELRTPAPVRELTAYAARSYPAYRLQPELDAASRRHYLALPAGRHPQARELAGQLGRGAAPAEIVERAEAWFRQRPFVYTLRPPLLQQDPVDQFLFETRRGFCEHYAGAFAVLMRAAGIPARVVTGYQGGELNPASGYMVVRQSDAHAWTEVWLPGEGWRRIDPTGFVAPQRVEQGLAEAVPADDPVPAIARPGGGWLKDLRLQWDALNNGWNQWVLAYGPEFQRQLLGDIGLGSWPRMAAALAGTLALVLSGIAAWVLRQRLAPASDPVQRAYQRFCAKLARRGVVRAPQEGPEDFAARAALACPQLATQIQTITKLYCLLRYQGHDHGRWQQRLRQEVARFRP